jgi:hypothetical protein
MASQRPAASSPAITGYLHEAANLISSRVGELADSAVRHRPPWMQSPGQPPNDPDHERQWLQAVAIVAAYREQFGVKTNDPSRPRIAACLEAVESGTVATLENGSPPA